MNRKDYLSFLNVAGSVSSILALLLTLSTNVTFALGIEILVAIAFFIATSGVLGGYAYRLNKWLINSNKWMIDGDNMCYHLLFWLVSGLLIICISAFFSAIGFYVTRSILDIGIEIIISLKTGEY